MARAPAEGRKRAACARWAVARAAHLPAARAHAQGYEGMQRDVERCMRNAHVLKDMLEMVGIKTMLNELSNTVVFERPLEEAFVRKWQLACEGDIAHVVVMPNITIAKLEEFVQDLIQSRARMSIAAARRVASIAKAAEEDDEEAGASGEAEEQ